MPEPGRRLDPELAVDPQRPDDLADRQHPITTETTTFMPMTVS